ILSIALLPSNSSNCSRPHGNFTVAAKNMKRLSAAELSQPILGQVSFWCMGRTSFHLISNINCKFCGRIIQRRYLLIVDGACQFMWAWPQSSRTESDMVRSAAKRSIRLPRKSELGGNHSFELAMTFLRRCTIYFPKASPFGSLTSHLSKFTLLLFATSLLSIKYHSKKCLPSQQAITSSCV